jgi:hypothetical protein
MAHPSDVLKAGDIALGRFAAAQFVDTHHRETGTKIVGKVLPAHPLLVLDVDKHKREATVMLLGTEKEGNGVSQLGFNKKEQELAKLERQTVFKPHSLSVMPLEKLYPNQGGHVSEETMARVTKELSRTIQDKTVTVTHLGRDGAVSMYDMARQRPGRVIMEAPPRGTATLYGADARVRPPRCTAQTLQSETQTSSGKKNSPDQNGSNLGLSRPSSRQNQPPDAPPKPLHVKLPQHGVWKRLSKWLAT